MKKKKHRGKKNANGPAGRRSPKTAKNPRFFNPNQNNQQGNKFFGKYQPKCHKEGKPYNQKDINLYRGKSWTDENGHLAEQKEHDKDEKVPDWDDDKVPKIKGIKKVRFG